MALSSLQHALHTAEQYYQVGDFKNAEASFRQILQDNPDNAFALHMLGMIGHSLGQSEKALPFIAKSIQLKPDEWGFYNNLGLVYQSLGKIDMAIASIQRAIALAPNTVYPLHTLAVLYESTRQFLEAVNTYSQIITLDPTNIKAQEAIWNIKNRIIRDWHFPMMNDTERNDAYEQAIRNAVNSNSQVLDIGTGSGLLAMMAARAGCKHVTTCESFPLIAEKAKEIIRRNHLEDSITVITKPSLQLQPGKDGFPEKADILITETFDSSLIGEGALEIFAHARKHLLKENAVIIPAKAVISGMVITSDDIRRDTEVHMVSGFDLSPFNTFRKKPSVQLLLAHYAYTQLSDVTDCLSFDFMHDSLEPQTKDISFPITQSGTAHGIAYWFTLFLDKDTSYTTSPLTNRAVKQSLHWQQCVQMFDTPIPVTSGTILSFHVRQWKNYIVFDTQPSPN